MTQTTPEYVMTTRPIIPPYHEHPTLVTSNPHVILRPFRPNDLDALHQLRTQIEVMKWTATGRVDADLHRTRIWMSLNMDTQDEATLLAQNEMYPKRGMGRGWNFVVLYRHSRRDSDSETITSEEVIGAGGCHIIEPEPEVGYMLRKEWWGQGIASAVLNAVLESYWALERTAVKVPWDPEKAKNNIYQFLSGDHTDTDKHNPYPIVREVLNAEIDATNIGSRRVLEKCGFSYRSSQTIEHNGGEIELAHYVLVRP